MSPTYGAISVKRKGKGNKGKGDTRMKKQMAKGGNATSTAPKAPKKASKK